MQRRVNPAAASRTSSFCVCLHPDILSDQTCVVVVVPKNHRGAVLRLSVATPLGIQIVTYEVRIVPL